MPSSARPAPAGIYTLSLHDALPIFAPAVFLLLSTRRAGADPATVAPEQGYDLGTIQSPRDVAFGGAQNALGTSTTALYGNPANLPLDRKSTRLNSSHSSISYAVFCSSCARRDLHSFPTRRSSDLRAGGLPAPFHTKGRRGSGDRGARAGVRPGDNPEPARCRVRRRAKRAWNVDDGALWQSCEFAARSEEHTSELQSQFHLVCRLLLVLRPPGSTLFPYTTLFRSSRRRSSCSFPHEGPARIRRPWRPSRGTTWGQSRARAMSRSAARKTRLERRRRRFMAILRICR